MLFTGGMTDMWKLGVMVLACGVAVGCSSDPRSRLGGKLLGDSAGTWEDEEPKKSRRRPVHTERKLESRKLSISEVAAGYRTGEDCEKGARKLWSSNPGGAWALLRACVYERELHDLRPLLDAPWARVHRERWTESARMLTFVIAQRGGNLDLDLESCRERQLPFARLVDAFEDPDSVRGKLIVMRGLVIEGDPSDGKSKIRLAETSLGGSNYEPHTTWGARRAAARHGGRSGLSGNRRSYGRNRGTVNVRNNANETGREVVASAASASRAKLQIDTEYVFLVRFKGTKLESDDPYQEPFALASIIDYFPPAKTAAF